jgi:hypothetical protein
MLANEEKLVGERPFRGVPSPSTFLMQAATGVGSTEPDFAAPSGFLNLVTRCSARTPTALFHAESVRGVSCLQRLPPPARRHGFRRALPLLPFVAPRRERLQGLVRSGGPFTTGRCYPVPSADPLMTFCPLKGCPLESRLYIAVKPPLMGFSQRWIAPSL